MPDAWDLWQENLKKQRFKQLTADAVLTTTPDSRLEMRVALSDKGASRKVRARGVSGMGRERHQLLIFPKPGSKPRSKYRYQMHFWAPSLTENGKQVTAQDWEHLQGGPVVRYRDLVPLDPGSTNGDPYEVTYVKKEALGGDMCHVIEIRWMEPHGGPDKQWMWLEESDLLERRVEVYREATHGTYHLERAIEFLQWESHDPSQLSHDPGCVAKGSHLLSGHDLCLASRRVFHVGNDKSEFIFLSDFHHKIDVTSPIDDAVFRFPMDKHW